MRFHPSRRLVIAVGLILLLAAAGLLLLPEVARRMAVARLEARIAAPVGIEDIDLNLFTGRARVSNLVIGGGDGGRPILRLPTLDLGFAYRGLLRGELVLRYLTFNRPQLFVERTGPARFNIFEMIRPQEGGGGIRGLTVEHLAIQGGEVAFVDRTQSPPFERTLRAVHLTAGRLSTLPTLVLTPTSFALGLEIGQGSIAITGSATPLGRPAGLEVTARVEHLDPAIFSPYLPTRPKVDLTGSWMSGEARYVLTPRQGESGAHVLTASVAVGPARVLPSDGQAPVLTVAGLAAKEIRLDLLANRGDVGELVVRQPHLRLDRGPGGAFNVVGLFPTGPRPAADRAPQAGTGRAGLSIRVARARVEAGSVEFVDRTTAPAVKSTFRDLRLALRDLSLAPSPKPGQVEGEARMGEASVRVTGTLQMRPFATRLVVAANGVPLDPFRGYVNAALGDVETRGGRVQGVLEMALAPRRDNGLDLQISGTVEGRDLALGLPGSQEPLFSAQRLAIDLARMGITPALDAELARIQIVGATLRLERDRAGNLNLRRLGASPRPRSPTTPREPALPSSQAARSPIAIRRVEVAEGRIEFVDATITPTFTGGLSAIRAELRQTADQADRMTLKLQGTLDDSAPLELSGWLTPLDRPLRLHLEGTLRDYALTRLNPYAEQYIRYRIRRGRVSTEVEYDYDAGSFDAENVITIRQMQLGEQLGEEFRERVGIPLQLALSLLEDLDGEIRLRIPVSGNLTSPRFSLGGVVWDAIRNALLKLLAAPFRVLGTILTVGGKIGEVRIAPVGFLPGSLDPDPDASERLAKLVEFLKAKPRVELQLRGYATRQEVEALKRRRLREQAEAVKAGTYEERLTRLYRAAGGDARVNPPTEDKERFLLERIAVTEQDLRRLAEDRAWAVEGTLVRRGVEAGRLFVVSTGAEALTDAPPGRVEFDLLY